MAKNKDPITVVEAAKELGVSERRVTAMIGSGRLKAKKFGRAWMIDPADLDAVRDRKPGRPWDKDE